MIKILKSVKLKQQDISSEVLVVAIDVKCKFLKQINSNQGKMLNIVAELVKGELETRLYKLKAFFSKTSCIIIPTLKFQDFL